MANKKNVKRHSLKGWCVARRKAKRLIDGEGQSSQSSLKDDDFEATSESATTDTSSEGKFSSHNYSVVETLHQRQAVCALEMTEIARELHKLERSDLVDENFSQCEVPADNIWQADLFEGISCDPRLDTKVTGSQIDQELHDLGHSALADETSSRSQVPVDIIPPKYFVSHASCDPQVVTGISRSQIVPELHDLEKSELVDGVSSRNETRLDKLPRAIPVRKYYRKQQVSSCLSVNGCAEKLHEFQTPDLVDNIASIDNNDSNGMQIDVLSSPPLAITPMRTYSRKSTKRPYNHSHNFNSHAFNIMSPVTENQNVCSESMIKNDMILNQHATLELHENHTGKNIHEADLNALFDDSFNVDENNMDDGPHDVHESFSRVKLTEARVDGRRITDNSYVNDQLHDAFDIHDGTCPGRFVDMRVVKTIDIGMRTNMVWQCQNCYKTANVWTTPKNPADDLRVDYGAVLGSLTSGICASNLQEQLASMGVPSISQPTYCKIRQALALPIHSLCEKEMKKAAEEEKELAKKNNDVTLDGHPFITVIGDGCWGKRVYAHGSYDALSGAAVLIGSRTNKVVFSGVRNAYCSTCDKAKSNSKPPHPNHKCHKNWFGSSTAMEADIINEGFMRSMDMYGLIYKTLIADGDSSVMKRIHDSDPYRDYKITVNKIECINHLFRNFGKKIKSIANQRWVINAEKKIAIIPLRERVKGSALSMRRIIEAAVTRRSAENGTWEEKVERLTHDIEVTPYHVFGNHEKCDKTNKSCDQKVDDTYETLMRVEGLFRDIQTEAVKRLALNADSLLLNLTNNPAEQLNSLINKAVGGKRVNHSLLNSYELRVESSVIQFNTLKVLSKFYEFIDKKIPTAVINLETNRDRQRQITANYRQRTGRRNRCWHNTDKDYGPSCNKPDLEIELYNKAIGKHFKWLRENQQNRDYIAKETVAQSGSELWLELHKKMITASRFGPICRMKESTSCKNMVKSIVRPPYIDNTYVRSGIEKESVAREQLSKELNKKITPCGLFIDSDIPYLGASPDGLIDEDGIVEIKTWPSLDQYTPEEAMKLKPAFRRVFDGKNIDRMNSNHHHYYQVQGQLHITQRSYCIFAVWTSYGLKYVKVLKDDEFWGTKMEKLLIRFYENCLLPEIVDSRLHRSMPIRDPQYILAAKEHEEIKRATVRKRKMCMQHTDRVDERGQKRRNLDGELDANDICEVHDDNECTANCANSETRVRVQMRQTDALIPEARELLEIVRDNVTVDEVIPNINDGESLLNDSAIQMFMNIIEKTNSFDVHPVMHFSTLPLLEPSKMQCDLQIIGGQQSVHWRCIFFHEESLFIYDSLYTNITSFSEDERAYFSRRYPDVNANDIRFIPVERQPDKYSCGVYAAAFATTIALGGDPSVVRYSDDALRMRQHFIKVLQRGKLIEFPTA